MWDPLNVRPGLSDILKSSMQTLKHVVVVIYVDDDDVDPLFGIPSELEDIRTKNILETITIHIMLNTPDANCRRGNDWDRLDEVLTTPGWLSLKQVSLIIEIDDCFEEDDELHGALRAFQNIREKRFPRSSCNSNLLNFSIRI